MSIDSVTVEDVMGERRLYMAVLVSALGYFVDVYDLVLFSVVRVASVNELGFAGQANLEAGVFLLNMQMGGMLLGGLIWGLWGDKRGRLSVLFGSIFVYSLANIANGFVEGLTAYAIIRFIAGLGLAGELGAGITLVAEIMHREKRGYGTTIVATVGVCGAIVAALVGEYVNWRTAYILGGVMGLALLVLRISVHESGMFKQVLEQNVKRGDLSLLVKSVSRVKRYISCILIGVPIWCTIGILMTFAPEISQALGVTGDVTAGRAILFSYIGLVVGDLASGLLSQYFRSRKKIVGAFLLLTAIGYFGFLNLFGATPLQLYLFCIPVGFAVGYWAVFVTTAAEQFGTNLRATVATTVPNFVRGAVVLITTLFKSLKPEVGILNSASVVGALCLSVAFLALFMLRETFDRDLNFVEE